MGAALGLLSSRRFLMEEITGLELEKAFVMITTVIIVNDDYNRLRLDNINNINL
jgi:hypothetical protein